MDSENSVYEKLVAQCKSNDVDVKVDALTKLQALFEKGGLEVPDSDTLINILKLSLRTSNIHLTNATLSALPPILTFLISRPGASSQLPTSALTSSTSTSSLSATTHDIFALRSALNAFLPPGGVIDRLGEREKVQVKARETLVILGGYAFRSGAGNTKAGKGGETPIAIFERYLKEGGLASKVWKVREQSITTLVHIRQAHHLFPIRPYLVLLVDCLEDTDPHVRDCARQAVVQLFTGPGVTDAARADLKNQMAKKGVRKTIVDGVLSKLLGGGLVESNSQSQEASENGDGKKEYIPPSLALQNKRPRVASQNTAGVARMVSGPGSRELPRPKSRAAASSPPPPQTPNTESADIRPVYIASSRDLENEFAQMLKPFEGKETEHNWAARDQAIQRVRGMLKGDVHIRYPEPFLAALKDGFISWSTKTLASLRTTVAVNTCLLYSELAVALGTLLDPHCEVLYTHLLKMAGFTKKITAQQSQASVAAIMTHTSAQPRLVIPLLWHTLQEKIVQARAYMVGNLKLYLEIHGQRSKNAIDASNMLETLEKFLKKALADANPASRESARVLFWVFEGIWQDRGRAILEGLDAVARKQLEKACPNPTAQPILPPSTPVASKKTSVAAAIAASRAKARAIATAPPSLRHQATSGSHSASPKRAGSPSSSSRNSLNRPTSPLRLSTSPPSPSRRAVSSTITRATSAGSIPMTSHVRIPSGGSDKAQRSTSPSLSDSGAWRRLSSPLVTTSSTTRKPLSAKLPPSPPSSMGQLSPMRRASVARSNGSADPPTHRSISQMMGNEDDSDLLMAQKVPIPDDDSDSEDGNAVNLMSFSSAFEAFPPIESRPKSQPITLSPASDSRPTLSNALSSSSVSDMASSQQLIVEDALRARAEQAESAAERLLELVEPEEEESLSHHHSLPPSLLKTANGYAHATPKAKVKPIPLSMMRNKLPPVTPNNRASVIMRQAALFEDSPARNGRSTSLLDALQNTKQETGWGLKRKALSAQVSAITTNVSPARVQELETLITALDSGDADVAALKRLALICMENTVAELSSPPLSPEGLHPSSPTPIISSHSTRLLHSDIWEKNKTFDRFFKALIKYLEPSRAEEELAYGLIVAWEVLESQSSYLDGKEGDLFSMILRVRYCNKVNVLEGTNAIRDALTSKADPVYGLTTMHASLRLFYSEPPPTAEDEEIKAATYAFGLMALGKFILRLPAEIAEEEIPRLKGTLITALNDKSSLIVRESAAASIIAAQLVLRDETHLFTLLDGLADEKKNLLTYLFDKHGAREAGNINSNSGIDKLEKEIRRLDTRTSTPLRSGV